MDDHFIEDISMRLTGLQGGKGVAEATIGGIENSVDKCK